MIDFGVWAVHFLWFVIGVGVGVTGVFALHGRALRRQIARIHLIARDYERTTKAVHRVTDEDPRFPGETSE